MMPPFVVFPTNRIAHFVEVSLYLFYLAQQVKLYILSTARYIVSKRKIPRNRKVSGVFLYSKKRIVRKFIRLETVKYLSAR